MSQDSLRRRIQERWERWEQMTEMTEEKRYGVSNINDPQTITRDQLRDALQELTTYDYRTNKRTFKQSNTYHFDQADSVIRWIHSPRKAFNVNTPERFQDKTITYQELVEAVKSAGGGSFINPDNLFQEALNARNRNAEKWETGDIVRSVTGNVFTRLANGKWKPETMGVKAEAFENATLQRPLTLIGRAV